MSSFEYFATLLSIILGFSLAGVVRSIGRFLISPDRFSRNSLAALWNFVLLFQLIIFWIVIWRLFSSSEVIHFWELILYSLATVVLYLASFVLESNADENLFWDVTRGPRVVFFSCLAIHMLAVVIHAHFLTGYEVGNLMGVGVVVLCLVGLTLRDKSHHLVLACLYLASLLTIGFTGAAIVFTD